MSLRRLVVESYRCFRDPQELVIHPITVVLGKNNSGKSALVRAPLVFATGFGTESTAPLDLDRLGFDSVDAFTDLIFEHSPHRKIRVELGVDGESPFDMAATIQHFDEKKLAFVSELTLRAAGIEVGLGWEHDTLPLPQPTSYTVWSDDSSSSRQRIDFRGLVPVTVTPELQGLQGMRLSLGPIRYLSPYRERFRRQHNLPLGSPQELGQQGEGLPGILAHDRARAGGELIDAINEHLHKIVPEWRLDEEPIGPLWATVLTRSSASQLRVNLADAGAGLAQVLPIIVQCALDERASASPRGTLQIIEEPEMHLHPAAHAELADLYLRTARTTGTAFLIETHSETLLLRLRRRVAEGEYRPEMIGIYFVTQEDGVSTVRRVDLDELGDLHGAWPDGYFSQDYHEARAIASARLDRTDRAS